MHIYISKAINSYHLLENGSNNRYTILLWKKCIILKGLSFKDIIERKMFNVVGKIYVLGWEDNIEKIEIIPKLLIEHNSNYILTIVFYNS